MRLNALVLALSFSSSCLAQHGSESPNSICGSVVSTSTHHAIGSAWISIYTVLPGKLITSTGPSQKSAVDGSFCFHSLPSGEYLLLAHKSGFVPASVNPQGAIVADITVPSGSTSQPLRLSLVPVPSVSEVPDRALKAVYTAEQRLHLTFFAGAFSPGGRYLAFEISDVNTGDPEQVWRYDLATHQLLAVTAKPTSPADPQVDDLGWDGEVLYTKLNNGYGRELFSRTEDDVTSSVSSWPPNLNVLKLGTPRDVGTFSVEEEMNCHGCRELVLGSGSVITQLLGDEGWTALDDPPMVIAADARYRGIVLLDLRSIHRRSIRLPAGQVLNVLAAWHGPNSIRIAYEVNGPCDPPQGLDPMMIPGNDNNKSRPHHLCFVEVQDRPQPSDLRREPKGQ